MPTIDVVMSCPVHRSFRVEQLAGMFDVELEEKLSETFSADVPSLDEAWDIGVIVGPSGSGKSTIARHAFGKCLWKPKPWPKKAAVIDGFGDLRVKEIAATLTAVGFSSPPSWVKPFAVLSNGEQFRCELARALLADRPLVVYDEFTSVVDRTVAKIGSAAVAKAIRTGRIKRRFVAVTCHYDVVEWLQPDWVLDMASGRLARGRLRRPQIEIEVAPVHRSAWVLFRRHHYLSGSLSTVAKCFAAFSGETPVAFSAWQKRLTHQSRRGDWREHRTVVLPDFQGVGIGNRLSAFCAAIFVGLGGRAFSTTSHPAMIHHRSVSPLWRRIRLGMVNPGPAVRRRDRRSPEAKHSCARLTGGFQFVGPGLDRQTALAFFRALPAPFAKNPEQLLIDAAIRRHPGATIGLLARISGRSASGVKQYLDRMIEMGEVVRCGSGRPGDPYAHYDARNAPTD